MRSFSLCIVHSKYHLLTLLDNQVLEVASYKIHQLLLFRLLCSGQFRFLKTFYTLVCILETEWAQQLHARLLVIENGPLPAQSIMLELLDIQMCSLIYLCTFRRCSVQTDARHRKSIGFVESLHNCLLKGPSGSFRSDGDLMSEVTVTKTEHARDRRRWQMRPEPVLGYLWRGD